MNPRHVIKIPVNAANPIDYLACCGLFEIAARFDETALAHWQQAGTTDFVLDTTLPESVLCGIILSGLADWRSWRMIKTDTGEVIRLEACFVSPEGRAEKFHFDWWYESLMPTGEINKSGWKMYAGQQKAEKIAADMVQKSAALSCASLAEILQQTSKVSGSFGFDPMASRKALDVGFSLNDLGLPAVTNPLAQLLAMFGVQNFFTPRTRQANEIVSSRGWRKNAPRKYAFTYSLWFAPTPISLARHLANVPRHLPPDKTQTFSAPRASRDKYSNLTLAVPVVSER